MALSATLFDWTTGDLACPKDLPAGYEAGAADDEAFKRAVMRLELRRLIAVVNGDANMPIERKQVLRARYRKLISPTSPDESVVIAAEKWLSELHEQANQPGPASTAAQNFLDNLTTALDTEGQELEKGYRLSWIEEGYERTFGVGPNTMGRAGDLMDPSNPAVQLPDLNTLEQANHPELQAAIDRVNAASDALRIADISDLEKKSQLCVIREAVAHIYQYRARCFKDLSYAELAFLFEGKDSTEKAKTFQTFANNLQIFGDVFNNASPFNAPKNNNEEENAALRLRAQDGHYIVEYRGRGGLESINVTPAAFKLAVAAFKEIHGVRSIIVENHGDESTIKFNPNPSFTLHPHYYQYEHHAQSFVELLKKYAAQEEKKNNAEFDAEVGEAAPGRAPGASA